MKKVVEKVLLPVLVVRILLHFLLLFPSSVITLFVLFSFSSSLFGAQANDLAPSFANSSPCTYQFSVLPVFTL